MIFPPPPPDASNSTGEALRTHNRLLAAASRLALAGKLNAVLDFTCTANAASSTLSDSRLAQSSFIAFDPLTANAAAELAAGTIYVLEANRNKQIWTITHANAATTDRSFRVLVIG